MNDTDNGDPAFIGTYDWKEISPTAAIIEAVASVDKRSQTELDPLYNAVDPDALTELVDGNTSNDGIELTFPFESYQVTVRGDGTIIVVTLS